MSVGDTLSRLPEEIVSHILYLMPTKFAVPTNILSQRWRYTWKLVTSLNFDDTHASHGSNMSKIVDSVLEHCKTSQVNLFRLHFSNKYYCVSSWIDKAVRLNVLELDIQVIRLALPLSLFTCQTLTKLRLHRNDYDESVWEFPCLVSLPSLKTLDIAVFNKPRVNAFKLISGCPMLESLSLEITWQSNENYIFNIPTLKRLKLTLLKCLYSGINKVVLNVPNLEYLFVGGVLGSFFVMEDVSSLVEASVSFYKITYDNLWVQLLKGLNGVKSFSAENKSPLIDYKILCTSPLPIFLNMNHLELKGFWPSRLVPQVLESCPKLKHLYIEKEQKHEESYWIEPKLVPACMLTELTTIKFTNWIGKKSDKRFLEYMLGNAKVLKKVTVTYKNLCIGEEMRLFAHVFKLPRASRYCEIHFHGNSFHSLSS